jgi:hypothetical protein
MKKLALILALLMIPSFAMALDTIFLGHHRNSQTPGDRGTESHESTWGG